jgi:hypothetical protein
MRNQSEFLRSVVGRSLDAASDQLAKEALCEPDSDVGARPSLVLGFAVRRLVLL